MSGDFYTGILMVVIGFVYMFIKLFKEKDNNINIFTNLSNINSWGIIIFLIVGGVIIIFR
ncbi:hypothetical protein BTO13_12690 [Polaribacter gangjinensis]|uniref:Uncharacterized protein n=1 Tax=Polaribacter gangjinensis TaxID=574710 RepID=A0A2S7WEG5_9FLAO|nr:hypothetical protein BTO13_12690 [Polaribacter gangjinensis]